MSIATLAATAVAIGITVGAPVGVATSPDGPVDTVLPSPGGWCIDVGDMAGCFDSYGDRFRVYDFEAGGGTPTVRWRAEDGRSGTCRWTGESSVTDCDLDLPEGTDIDYRLEWSGDGVDGGTDWYGAVT
jgi:hypothetical protein